MGAWGSFHTNDFLGVRIHISVMWGVSAGQLHPSCVKHINSVWMGSNDIHNSTGQCYTTCLCCTHLQVFFGNWTMVWIRLKAVIINSSLLGLWQGEPKRQNCEMYVLRLFIRYIRMRAFGIIVNAITKNIPQSNQNDRKKWCIYQDDVSICICRPMLFVFLIVVVVVCT